MERELDVLLAVVFPMVAIGGAKELVATRELRVGLCTARPQGEYLVYTESAKGHIDFCIVHNGGRRSLQHI